MDLTAVRKVAINQTFQILGTPMIGTRTNGTCLPTRVVWDAADIETVDRNRQLGRSFWVNADDFPTVPRGTVFEGPEPHDTVSKTWRVDQTLAIEPGKTQVLVTEDKS